MDIAQMAKRGRPATGRNTKVVRVPLDMDMELAMRMYYDWLPAINEAKESLVPSPRYDKLSKLLDQLI